MSACLLGRACRYDGASKDHPGVRDRVRALREAGHEVVAVCPEELGELGTPRPAAELRGGDGQAVWRDEARVERVADGVDVTGAFRVGAERAAALVPGATHALLKARSPSCGVARTWIDGELRRGDGVFAALLRERGVQLTTEE